MEERMPKAGEFYLQFHEKKIYQILTVAAHVQTGERLVIYQALYGKFQTFACPMEQFNEKVDTGKDLGCVQGYCFQRITASQMESISNCEKKGGGNEQQEKAPDPENRTEPEKPEPWTERKKPEDRGEVVNPHLLEFLDADTYAEKYRVLIRIERDMTDRLINDMAVVLDVVIPEGNLEERFRQLKNCVSTLRKYEVERPRNS